MFDEDKKQLKILATFMKYSMYFEEYGLEGFAVDPCEDNFNNISSLRKITNILNEYELRLGMNNLGFEIADKQITVKVIKFNGNEYPLYDAINVLEKLINDGEDEIYNDDFEKFLMMNKIIEKNKYGDCKANKNTEIFLNQLYDTSYGA